MNNNNLYNLQRIKKLIENKVLLGPSQLWKQRDFENLIELIYADTRIRLSLSTLKRIWQDNYSGSPHPSTLDALASFAGYDNWYSFTVASISAKKGWEDLHGNDELTPTVRNIFHKPQILALIILVPVIAFAIFSRSRKAEVSFSTEKNVYDSLPATVTFNYSHRGKLSDSLFLISSGRPLVKTRLNPKQKEFKHEYRTPGIFTASILYGNKVIDSTSILIKSGGWVASLYHYNRVHGSSIETYINGNEIIADGKLNLSPEILSKNNIKIDGNLFTLYYYVTDPFEMDYDNFTLDITVKSDSIFNYPYPYLYTGLISRDGLQFIPLSSKGNHREDAISFSEVFMEGNTTDLSMFETDVYSWNNLRLENRNRDVSVYLNNSLLYRFSYEMPLEMICGFNILFLGSGSVDRLSLLDSDSKIIYSEDFN